MNTYNLEILSLNRELPLIKIKDDLAIASFVILGDSELVKTVAPEIAKNLKDIDVIVTAEAKGIPLAYEISNILGMKEFVVARKSIKSYMDSPITEEVNSITTQKTQFLCLDKVVGGIVTAKAAILAEGDAANRDDIIFIKRLPLFKVDDENNFIEI